jgi:hypothetical protein
LRRVAWYKLTDVSEVLASSIIKATIEAASSTINLKIEAASIPETSKNFTSTRVHGAITHKTAKFIFAAVRT